MGTRNLTIVISDNKTKIAQYGQWDGYPGGQGLTALNFLRAADLEDFKSKLSKISFFNSDISEKQWEQRPYLSRDLGAKILNAVMYGNFEQSDYPHPNKIINCNVDKLVDSYDFNEDSLFCEWAYVIDLDENVFEVYRGFNQNPLNKNERFYKKSPNTSGYYPIKLLKSYNLDNLPGDDDFLEIGNTEE